MDALKAIGHKIRIETRQGMVHAIAIDPDTDERIGAADLRGTDGRAIGY